MYVMACHGHFLASRGNKVCGIRYKNILLYVLFIYIITYVNKHFLFQDNNPGKHFRDILL